MVWGGGDPNGQHHRRRRANNDLPNLFNGSTKTSTIMVVNRARFTDRFIFSFFSEHRPANNFPAGPAPVSEENVTFLTSMGFSRERVIRALQRANGNVEAATNLLLAPTN